MITSPIQAEQYLKGNSSTIVKSLELHIEPSTVSIHMQTERSAAGHKAWSFILMGVDNLQSQAILWISDTENLFATLHEGLYPPQIEDWIALAVNKNDFDSVSALSLNYLLKLRKDGSQQKDKTYDEIDDDPDHCPVCGKEREDEIGVPDYVPRACSNCRKRTADKDGRSVSYLNTQMSGGMQASYIDTTDFYLDECGNFNQICFIDKRPFEVTENTFGGFIFAPVLLG